MWEMHQNAHNSKIFLTIYIGPRWPAVHLSYYLVSMFNYALFEFESFFNYVILSSKNLLAFSFLNDIAELPPSFQKRKQKANMSRRRSGMRTCRTFGGGRKGKILQRNYQEIGSQENVISQFFNLWVAHAPVRLQGLIVNWIQKEKDSQLAAHSYRLKV